MGEPTAGAGSGGIGDADGGSEDVFADLIAPCSPDEFFANIWQKEPKVFSLSSSGDEGSCGAARRRRPLHDQTWADCCDMLAFAWGALPFPPPDGCDLLIFEGKQLTYAYDPQGPCAALLNGASCVVNHAEYIWPPMARVCLALRERLVHVYCNSYVTPLGCQAVPPHADDRDVFVVQLQGRKLWRVFGTPPVPLPYSDEQVGKNGLAIPPQLLEQRPVIECVLECGDVLYMPRGFVHEAQSPADVSSWHATLAVATHDWSWSKVLAGAVAQAMDAERSARWRAAVPLSLGPGGRGGRGFDQERTAADADLEDALQFLRQTLQASSLRTRFEAKIAPHNRTQTLNSDEFARKLADFLDRETEPSFAWPYWRPCAVGSHTRVRRATDDETDDHLDRLMRAGLRFAGDKGKGKGKQMARRLIVRDEAAAASDLALRAVRDGPPEGLTVGELMVQLAGSPDCKGFDELAAHCLIRASVLGGVLSAADGRRVPGDFRPAARVHDAL